MAGIDNNTVLYLRGDSFEDLSLSPKTITNSGVTIIDDIRKCLNVYGTSQILNITHSFKFDGDFTVESFVKLDEFSTGFQEYILNGQSTNKEYLFGIDNASNKVNFRNHSSGLVLSATNTFPLNKFVHVAFVRKDGLLKIFLDGKLNNSVSFDVAFTLTNPKIENSKSNITSTVNFYNYRISNVARYTENFTPPTQLYNSITIDTLSQTATNVNFSVTKLGQETINKVEVLQDNEVKATYTEGYDNLIYNFEGSNDVTIRVTYDDNYTEEKTIKVGNSRAKIYLYKEGNECVSLTGGWDESLFTIDSSYARASVTKESEYMLFNITSNSKMSRIGCNNLINFSLFGSLFLDTYFYYTNNGTGYYAGGEIDADKTFGGRLEKVSLENMLGHKIVNQKIISTGNNYFSIYSSIAPITYVNPNKFCITNVYVETKENVLTINSQENDVITFSAKDLGLVTINKIDVLVNGIVSQTYTDNYSNLSYTVDKSLYCIGNNNIEIRVTYSQGDDITETVSEYLTYKYDAPQLPLETPLLDTVERVKLLTKTKQNEKDMLSSILTSKNVEVLEEDKMSDLIGKVDRLDKYDDGKLWLYKDGKELVNFVVGHGAGTGTQSKNSNHLYLETTASSSNCRSYRTNERINLSGYSRVCIEWENVGANDSKVKSYLLVSDGDGNQNVNTVLLELSASFGVKTTFIDVSNISTSLYVRTIAYVNSVSGTTKSMLKIYKIWLEK